MKSKTVGKQPQQPAIDHRIADDGGDSPRTQHEDSLMSAPLAAAAAAADTAPATVGSGDESGPSSDGSQAREGDGKPATPSDDLTDEQHEVAKRFRKMKSQRDCPELNLGSALLDIKRNNRLPMRGGNIVNCEQLLGLDRLEVRRLVEVAEQHLAGQGGGTPARSADVRPSESSARKQPPAGSPAAADTSGSSAAPAPIAAPEKERFATTKSKVAEAVAPQAGEPDQDLALPPVETTQPGPAEPARASAEPVEPPAGAGTASLPETGPAAVPVGKLISIPPMLPADLTEDDWASRINEGMGEGIRRFINVGADLLAAKKAVGHGRWNEMFKSGRIKMSQSTATMLMRVAEHAALSNSQHLVNLPPSLTTLRVLAEGSVEVIETGIKDGKINPALTAKQAQTFVRAHCPRPVVKSAGKQSEADTPCPPPGTEIADLPKSPTEAVMTGAGDTSDNPPPALAPTEAAPSQPEPSHDEAPAPDGSPVFNLEIEWQPIEASLHKLFRRCPPDKLRGYWAKLTSFVEQHPDLVPAEERPRAG